MMRRAASKRPFSPGAARLSRLGSRTARSPVRLAPTMKSERETARRTPRDRALHARARRTILAFALVGAFVRERAELADDPRKTAGIVVFFLQSRSLWALLNQPRAVEACCMIGSRDEAKSS
jgi:hypothetical protein